MSERDLNLITDLISGQLSPGERDEALRYIASDPALQSEYETQLATASLLHDLPSPAMTAEERSTLHASLRQQLQLDDAPAPVVAPAPTRWQRWWAPVTGLAAAAAVIVAVVVILPSGSEDSFEAVSAPLTENTAQASGDANSSEGGGEALDGASADEEAAPTESAKAETTTTAAAAEETATTAAASAEQFTGDAPLRALPHVPDGDLTSIAVAYRDDPETFAREFDSLPEDGSSDAASGIDVCLAEASSAANTSVAVPIATTVMDGAESVVLFVTPPEGEPYLVALDAITCEELANTRP